MKKISILLVEDEASERFGLIRSLEPTYEVAFAATVEDAERCMRECYFDLIMLDINLAGVMDRHDTSGLKLAKQIRYANPEKPIIMITDKSNRGYVLDALRLRVDDFLDKPVNLAYLHASIQNILAQRDRSEQRKTGGDIQFGRLHLSLEDQAAFYSGQALYLTPTEFKILHVLVNYTGRHVAASHLMERSRDYQLSDAEASEALKPHLFHLRQKLDNAGLVDAIINKRGVGFMLQIPQDNDSI